MVSAIKENMNSWTKAYEKVTPDEKTLGLLKAFQGKASKRVASLTQSAEEVAVLVKSILLSEKPYLRYVTNHKYSHNEVSAKYADISGHELVKVLSKNYLETED